MEILGEVFTVIYGLMVMYSVSFSILLTLLMFTKKGRKEMCDYLKVILKEND